MSGFGGYYHISGSVFFLAPWANGDFNYYDIYWNIPRQFRNGPRDDLNNECLIGFEFVNWKVEKFRWDLHAYGVDHHEIPHWVNKQKCIETFEKVLPIWEECTSIINPANTKLWNTNIQLYEEYEKEVEKAKELVYTEYEKAVDLAHIKLKEARREPSLEFEKVSKPAMASMIKRLSEIDGYLRELSTVEGYCGRIER